MKFDFRKIASTAASVLMVGSTVGLAAAANYPSPFVVGGEANVGLVYGSTAASSDLVAAIDITNSLNSLITGDGTPTTITGESYALWTSSTKLYLNDTLNKARTVVSASNLPTILEKGTIQGDVTATYDQKIDISSTLGTDNRIQFGKHPTSDDDPTVALDLGTTKGNHAYNLTITFNKAVNFTHTDTIGEAFTLFGKEWTVGAETSTTSMILLQSAEKINLDSETNPSATVTVEGESYTIELVSASDTAATIRVTDSSGNSDTETVTEDKSKTIQGIEVAVTDADETNFALSATAIVGAGKIKLTDNSAIKVGSDETTLDGTNVRFGDDGGQLLYANLTKLVFQAAAEDSDVDALLPGGEFLDPIFGSLKLTFPNLVNDDDREEIEIKGSGSDKMTVNFQPWDGTEAKTINWLYNKTTASPATPNGWRALGYSMLGDSDGDAINVFERFQVNKSEYVVVGNEDSGGIWRLKSMSNTSDSIDDTIEFENWLTGDTASVTVNSEGSGTVDLGTKSYTVDYIIDTTKDDSAHTVRLRYQDGSRTTANNAVIYPSIETSKGASLAFYEPIVVNFSDWDSSGGAGANLSVLNFPDGDGYTGVTIGNTDTQYAQNYSIGGAELNTSLGNGANVGATVGQLTYNFTGGPGNGTVLIRLNDVGNVVIDDPAIVIFEEQDDATTQTYEALIVKYEGAGTTAASNGISDVETTWSLDTQFDEIQMESDTDMYKSMDFWGTIITTDQSDTDAYSAIISYPNDQVYADIQFAEAGAVTGGGSSLGSVTVKDNEVSQVSSNNLIVVGGSCVNTVAASLLGSDAPMCGAAWESATGAGSGSFLVQTWDSPFSAGKIATLVAGYNAGDTTNAATYIRTQNPSTAVGDKYIGTSATSATLQVA
jgi:hypothetical protein